jgi:hypothetical protein
MTSAQIQTLKSLEGRGISSGSGQTTYHVLSVAVGIEVILEGADRQDASHLPWEYIDRTCDLPNPSNEAIREAIGVSDYRHCSPLRALVYAIR